jgi:hypothetical protein
MIPHDTSDFALIFSYVFDKDLVTAFWQNALNPFRPFNAANPLIK